MTLVSHVSTWDLPCGAMRRQCHGRGGTIDLTKRAGEALGMIEDGLTDITVEVLSQPPG